MNKAKNVKEFVERIDSTKKVNPKDLSSDQDLTIAIMNLISIEEHLVFSGAKTGKNSFYDLKAKSGAYPNTCLRRPCALWKSEPNSRAWATRNRPMTCSIRPTIFTACFGD